MSNEFYVGPNDLYKLEKRLLEEIKLVASELGNEVKDCYRQISELKKVIATLQGELRRNNETS
jgi:hypothetical protein